MAREYHGKKSTPEYHTWKNMRRRCCDSKNQDWHRYGGRGITVCPEWRSSFTAFLGDLGERPTSKHTLDRYPDRDGNYEPGNCRWATPAEQARNSSRNHWITFKGQTRCLQDWATELGVTHECLRKRIKAGVPLIGRLRDPNRCRHGHLLAGDNLYCMPMTSNQAGTRICKTCKREDMARFLIRRGKRRGG